jgi:hypothetical protein
MIYYKIYFKGLERHTAKVWLGTRSAELHTRTLLARWDEGWEFPYGPPPLSFVRSSKCAVRTGDNCAVWNCAVFSPHVYKNLINFTQFAMNTGHFIIIENYVMMSSQENLCHSCSRQKKKEIRGHKKNIIILQLRHDLHLWWLASRIPVLSWLGRYNLEIPPSKRIQYSDITQRIL